MACHARIRHLESMLVSHGLPIDEDMLLPKTWADFADWCDRHFPGRLILAPRARRGVKSPDFQDVELAAKCLQWLATTCRDRFLRGGGSLSNVPVLDGVENAPCGSDAFEFDFQDRRLKADWHIKSGGNTRDPRRCLRIYYAFDDQTQQIVVAAMPAHERTGAT